MRFRLDCVICNGGLCVISFFGVIIDRSRWFIKVRDSIKMSFYVKLSYRLQRHHYLPQ